MACNPEQQARSNTAAATEIEALPPDESVEAPTDESVEAPAEEAVNAPANTDAADN